MPTPPASPFAAQLAAVRTAIAALTPAAGGAFTACAGDLPVEDEPDLMAGLFEVRGDVAAGVTQGMMSPANREAKRAFVVTILYDSLNDNVALEAAVAADDDQIIGALEAGRVTAPNIRTLLCTGAALVKSGQFWRRSLTFDCLYVHSF